jgi:hypothetical protein
VGIAFQVSSAVLVAGVVGFVVCCLLCFGMAVVYYFKKSFGGPLFFSVLVLYGVSGLGLSFSMRCVAQERWCQGQPEQVVLNFLFVPACWLGVCLLRVLLIKP